ncbi:MAG: efflux RND transporter periplasmic adaptor subunit [Bacteroidota bacterium]|nr:efflux RND transporter periplasmic adaptor subunit [Bacteroidota bacterium]
MTRYNFISFIFISILFLGLASCKDKKKSEDKAQETEILPEDIVEMRADQAKLANIETGTVEMRSLNGTLKTNGVVAVMPQNLATVCAPMGGFVKSTSQITGNAVRKGQTLAILQNQEFIDIQQNYLDAKSKLEFAEAEYRRYSELYKNDVYSQKSVQQVISNYKSLKAQVIALGQKLKLIGINPSRLRAENIRSSIALVSPINGYIKTVNVNIGKYVSPTDVLFEVVNSNKLFLELTLFEKDAEKVAIGQKIHFFADDITNQLNAVVYQTSKSINADKTYKIYANVTGVCHKVLPGMYVNATIETTSHNVTALPSDAVVSFDDKDYIFVFNRNKEENGKPFTEYRIVEVQKGITDDGYTEVTLPAGFDIKNTRIVVKGAYTLLSAKKNAGEMSC